MGVTPIRVREGSPGHRALVLTPRLIGLAVILAVPFAGDLGISLGSIDQATRVSQLNQLIAFAVAILGLDLVVGYSGQLSLGQSAFVGLGAYTTVILVADHHWSYLATLPVSAVVCFLGGLVVGIPAARVRGMYLAVVTLCVAYVFPPLVLKYEWLTGGANGKGPPRTEGKLLPPSWMPFADDSRMAEPLWVYCLCVMVAAVMFLLARNFLASRPGRALVAVRDNPASALAFGVDVPRYRAMAFGVSAMYGGIAGSLLMFDRPFASEVQFGTRLGIFLVVGLVAGGVGTMWGAIAGAFVYLFVPYFVTQWTFDQSGMPFGLRQLTSPLFALLDSAGGAAVGIVFGLTLLALLFLLPGGFASAVRRLRSRLITVVPDPTWLRDRPRPQPDP